VSLSKVRIICSLNACLKTPVRPPGVSGFLSWDVLTTDLIYFSFKTDWAVYSFFGPFCEVVIFLGICPFPQNFQII
jgi:hypothetical protein